VVQTVTGAASAALSGLVGGGPRPAEVVAALPVALHLAVDGHAVCLCWGDAVRLPNSVVLGAGVGAVPGARGTVGAGVGAVPGARGTVGGGRIELPGLRVRVTRWWRAPRPALHAVAGVAAPPLDDAGTAAAVGALVRGIRRLLPTRGHEFPAQAVLDLLGRGPGLTPLGDDVLAGALVTLRAAGAHAAARALAVPVLAHAPTATTFVSAALLAHAARGEAIPQLAALLHALGTPAQDAARTELLRVGHTSGAGLLHGVAAALAALDVPARAAS
jgi:hypothetical protein